MLKRLARSETAPPWSLFAGLSALFALFLAIIIGSTVAQQFLGDDPITLLVGWSAGAMLGIIFVLTSRRRTEEDVAALRIEADADIRLPLIALFCVGMAVTFDVIGLGLTGNFWTAPELFPYFTIGQDNSITALDLSIIAWLIALIFMVILQPIAEELVLRGVLYPSLRESLGAWMAILMSAVFHTLFHTLVYLSIAPTDFTRIWYAIAIPFLDALVITCVRAYTGSTRAAIVAHAAFGAFAVLKAFTLTG